ncbi:MAG: cyanoexosortase A [Cyanomargarita calcarea GSE-NOS-MK-12-04C]|jgi:cyanoexosortase A|uniref:Cyanoexosortase A n=1 Tax=Cyanomargarita calcarea GSE-NOS-MK-12-04C TaxID=2839659 RepID=A0A951V104_9CYAN|nr:cyanoexosortase A [Cyanomargarita calcarea GSE-NOS-MK-12-04C]
MKATNFTTIQQLKSSQFWLLGIAASLIAIHLTLTLRANNSNLLGSSFLFWGVISSLIWEERHKLNLSSGIFSSLLGISIIAIVLLKTASLISFGGFLYLLPFIFAIALALLASGFQGLRQYQAQLLTLFFLGVPKLLPPSLTDISIFTAKFSSFVLWYSGFNVVRNDVNIHLPTGSVEVYSACSGTEAVFQLLGLAILFLLMFPQNLIRKIFIPVVAIILAFIVNGLRVALLAILVANGQQKAFQYWHHGDGSLIFSLIAVLLFGLFCWLLMRMNAPDKN